MKNLVSASTFIFCFSILAFAQTSNLPCPEIRVLAPTGLVSPGDIVTFSVNINGEIPDSDVEFEWTISGGTIIDQQGKPEIRVTTTEEMEGTNLDATVKAKGISENCNNEASETAVIQAFPSHRGHQPHQYDNLPLEEELYKIDNFLVSLQNNPKSKGYIFFEIEKDENLANEKKRLISVFNHIFKKRNFNRDLNIYDVCYAKNNITSLYIIPEGTSLPEISNCEKIYIDLK